MIFLDIPIEYLDRDCPDVLIGYLHHDLSGCVNRLSRS